MSENAEVSKSLLRRRRRNVVGGRSQKIEVKVTPVEREQLKIAADRAGVSVQRLMVAGALRPAAQVPVGREEKVAAWGEAVALRNLVSAIGVNLNQLAAQANSEREIPAEFAAACAGVDRALATITAAFNNVYNDPSTRMPE